MKLGLALSGGGIRGSAHIGVLKALEESNMKIYAIGGTSSGSIVSALYAMGYTPDEILKIWKYFAKSVLGPNTKDIVASVKEKKSIKIGGVASGLNIELAIDEAAKYKKVKNIADLKMPIAIPAVDIITNKKKVFTNTENEEDYYLKNISIGKATRASSSFPGMYAPLEYGKYQFVDGGVLDNVPVTEVKKLGCDKVIAVSFVSKENKKQNSIVNIASKSIDVMFEKLVEEELRKSNHVIKINVRDVNIFNLSKLEHCYSLGYVTAKQQIDIIKRNLEI